MDNYVVYHLHTMLSLLDSCTSYKDYIRYAKELGQRAICITEHGNCYNWIEKKMYCESTQYKIIYDNKAEYIDDKKKLDNFIRTLECEYEVIELKPIKFLFGIEVYITANKLNAEQKTRDNYHTILIAKNYDGLKEINTFAMENGSKSDHFYFTRRITFDEFLSLSDNVIKISACLASPLNKFVPQNIEDEQTLIKLLNKYDYYEVQPHVNSEDQKIYNRKLAQLSKQFNKPLIAGTDTHSLNQYKAECRKILMKGKKNKYSYEENLDLTYKTYDELVNMFMTQGSLSEEEYMSAINNTNVMADSVEDFILDTAFKYPKLYDNEDAVFVKRIWDMYDDKVKRGVIKDDQIYRNNIKEELRVFRKIGMIGFMLFMSELVCWCWDNGIPVGFCRGSVGGSTIAYITDIIDVNPVKWGCVFSRFASEYRHEIGDIDLDISPDQRSKVFDYIISRFGKDNTAYVLAITTIAEKGCIDDIGRALYYTWIEKHFLNELVEISNRLREKKGDKNFVYGVWEIEKYLSEKSKIINEEENPYTLDKIAEIKKEFDINPEETKKKYKELFYYFDGLVGTTVSQSMHPAGIIVSPLTLYDNYGTFWSDGNHILAINMEECHEISLVKYDILGLKNIQIIRETCELAGIKYPKSHELNWDDKEVWKHITDSPVGIFQFEGSYAFDLLKRYGPKEINSLSLVNASLRPSGESYRDRLISGEINKNPSELIDLMLERNHGFLVFQEDTLHFLMDICGLSGSDADNIRRAIGRKQVDRLEAAMPEILEGYCSKSDKPRKVAEEEAKQFLQIISDSSNYQFGYNHSTGYSMIGYTCGYLRYYYPVEFITAYLNSAANDNDLRTGTELAKQIGIHMLRPTYGYSRSKFFCDANSKNIYKGIGSLKNMSEKSAAEIVPLYEKKYKDFVDILFALKEETTVNSRMLDILIKIDFFSEFGDINTLLWITQEFDQLYGKKSIKKDSPLVEFIGEEVLSHYSDSETPTHIDEINPVEFLQSRGIEDIHEMETLMDDCQKFRYEKHDDGTRDKIPNGISFTKMYKKFDVTEEEKKKFATKTVYGKYDGIHTRQLLKYLLSICKYPPCSIAQKIKYEQELLGYIDYKNPNLDKRYFTVTQLDTKYSPKFIAYCLNNGNTVEMRVKRKNNFKEFKEFGYKSKFTTFSEKPFDNGDILYLKSWGKEPKMKKVDNQWVKDTSVMYNWLYDYDIVNNLLERNN